MIGGGGCDGHSVSRPSHLACMCAMRYHAMRCTYLCGGGGGGSCHLPPTTYPGREADQWPSLLT